MAAAIFSFRAYPTAQIFITIVGAYILVFPTVDFLLAPKNHASNFAYIQLIILLLFFSPLVLFLKMRLKSSQIHFSKDQSTKIALNPYAPLILILNQIAFIFVSYYYDLYLVRINYGDFETFTGTIPLLPLAIYRISLESSFFIVIFLYYCLKSSSQTNKHRLLYKITFISYVSIFGLFFLVNSRMQFIILFLLLIACGYRPGSHSLKKVAVTFFAVLFLIVALTLLREFVIEGNDRLEASGSAALIRETIALIAVRLNSLAIVDLATEFGFNPFRLDLSGLFYFIEFNFAYFTDPREYDAIKALQLTSPSVYVINNILGARYVDFPKSMVVDTILIFGCFGLPVLAYFLASLVGWIQRQLHSSDVSNGSFVFALFLLPLVFQFEKEFLGFLINCIKWSPMLILGLVARPKRLGCNSTLRRVGTEVRGSANN